MLAVYLDQTAPSKYSQVVAVAQFHQPFLLVGIQIRPIDSSKRVIPAVRLFLVGFFGIYDLWDFTYLLIIVVVSNLCATLSNAATAPCEQDFSRNPSVSLCSRLNRSLALPRYDRTIGLGLPFTRLDSTIYQYLRSLELFA